MKTRQVVCEPTLHAGVFIPQQDKGRCFIHGYWKYFGAYSHDRQFVMLVEDLEDSVVRKD